MTKWNLYVTVDVLPIFITGSAILVAYFISVWYLLSKSIQCLLKRCFKKELPSLLESSCYQKFIFCLNRICPIKVSGFFKKYFQLKILNFLKNRSRPLVDVEYGPLDRELREDEDLLNSDHDPISPDVYVPLGIYVALISLITAILGLRSFLLRKERTCYEDLFDCYSLTGIPKDCSNVSDSEPFICYSWEFDLSYGITTFGGLTIAYYVALKIYSFLFQFCYRYIQILRHCLLVASVTLGTILVGVFNLSRNTYDGVTLFSICTGFTLPCVIPWEKLYSPDYMDDNVYDEETLIDVSVDNGSKFENDATPIAIADDRASCNTLAIDTPVKEGDAIITATGLQSNEDGNERKCLTSRINGGLIQ